MTPQVDDNDDDNDDDDDPDDHDDPDELMISQPREKTFPLG